GSWCQDSGQLPELRQGPQGARLQALASQPERQCSWAQERGGIRFNVTDYYSNQNQRDLVVGLADYLAKKLETLRPEGAKSYIRIAVCEAARFPRTSPRPGSGCAIRCRPETKIPALPVCACNS